MDFKKRLAVAIERKQCTRSDLAAAVGVSVQALSLVLTGKTNALTAENTAKAARFLNVDWYWLATGEGQMEAAPSWPIERIPVQRFLALSQADRAWVEAKLDAALKEREQPGKPRKTLADTLEPYGLVRVPKRPAARKQQRK